MLAFINTTYTFHRIHWQAHGTICMVKFANGLLCKNPVSKNRTFAQANLN